MKNTNNKLLKPFKKDFSFLDEENHRAFITVELTYRNNYPEFTASGVYCGSHGQCLDSINPKTEFQEEFINFWKTHHLKEVKEKNINNLTLIIKRIEEEEEDNKILNEMEEYGINENMLDACKAYLSNNMQDLSDFEESYNGEYESDEEFTQQLLEDCGDLPENLPHYIHIDWTKTAIDIMQDYFEVDGFYFRNM